MRKLTMASLLALSALSGSAMANVVHGVSTNEAGYKVGLGVGSNPASGLFQTITITSVNDNLIVNDIVVNRGHCKIALSYPGHKSEFPKRLGYSSSFTFESFACPNLLELTVYTNLGTVTYTPRD